MDRATLRILALIVLCGYALIWGAELLRPNGGAAIAAIALTALGVWAVRPGWDLRPGRFSGYWLALFGLLLASAGAAAWILTRLDVPLPYDFSTLRIVPAMPAILAITGIEELLFRQVMYQWLRRRQVSDRSTIVATALAFAGAHLGPLVAGSSIGATFYLLQAAYMVWVGMLLGETRRATGSWLMPWLGHFGYNVAVLYCLSIARPP